MKRRKKSMFGDQKTAKELSTFQSQFIFRVYIALILFVCEAQNCSVHRGGRGGGGIP